MKNQQPLPTISQQVQESLEEEEEELNPFPVLIFDADYCGEPVPSGFDAVRIPLDGKIKADLSWKREREAAKIYLKEGLKIFWDMDLGLPNALIHPLGNRTQFLSLTLSLEHFCKTLRCEFRKETIGLCLFRGSLDFSQKYPWDEEQMANLQGWIQQFDPNAELSVKETSKTLEPLENSEIGRTLLKYFCRDAVSEYLSLLTAAIPDSLLLFLMFDATCIEDPFTKIQLLNREYFSRFNLAVKQPLDKVFGNEIAWEGNLQERGMISREIKNDRINERPKLALCLPSGPLYHPSMTEPLNHAVTILQKHNLPFRVIPEGEFTMEWNELDELIVDTQFVTTPFRRKLQGFCAAGGKVIFLGKSLGLADEIPFRTLIYL